MHFNGILVSDDSDASDLEDITATTDCTDNESSTRYDPVAEFRNVSSGNHKSGGHVSDFEADVDAEFWHYNSITDAVRSVFDPLLWWGQQSFNFPILSCLGWQV